MSSTTEDSRSFIIFGAVLGALVFFTFFILLMANLFSPASDSYADPLVVSQQQERLMPVGRSRVAE